MKQILKHGEACHRFGYAYDCFALDVGEAETAEEAEICAEDAEKNFEIHLVFLNTESTEDYVIRRGGQEPT